MTLRSAQRGFTLIELLLTLALGSLLLAGVAGVIDAMTQTQRVIEQRADLARQARFAMDRMTRATAGSRRLLLPLADNPGTNWREHVREERVPPDPPEGDSSKATAVLAVTLSAAVDLDGNGFADADNDNDGRIDEDLPADASNDFRPGIKDIDDDGDGSVDEGWLAVSDDDEGFDVSDEDRIDGVDNDGDGSIDEDSSGDMNGDGAAGIAGVDDDGDGQIDESNSADDDEDEDQDEDWFDAVVFYLQGSALIERTPVPWNVNGWWTVNGADYLESPIAENVSYFHVERVPLGTSRAQLVELTLALTAPDGESFSITTRVRVASAP